MEQEIRQLLGKTMVVGCEILYFEELDSTNTYLKQAALDGAVDGTVVIAGCQTAGRGRMDRSFQSPGGKGLYLSALLRPKVPPERLLPVTALAGVAVCNTVERVCGVRPGLKWPNDLVLCNKKVSGILTELVMDEAGVPNLILGIGVNVSQTADDFTPDVAEIAASLAVETGRPVNRALLAAVLIAEVDRLYAALECGELSEYLEVYRRDCVNLGKTVQVVTPDGRETVTAVGIDGQFGLVVRAADGTEKTIRSGEVSVRGLYGYVK